MYSVIKSSCNQIKKDPYPMKFDLLNCYLHEKEADGLEPL